MVEPMPRLVATCAVLACTVAVAPPALAAEAVLPGTTPPRTPAPSAAGGLLVGFEDGVPAERRRAILRAAGGERGRGLALRRPVERVSPKSGLAAAVLRERLARDPDVRYVEPDAAVAISKVPNDTLLASQWGLLNPADHDIDAQTAWDTKTSCSKVAVLDTGVDTTHPDLQGNLWKNSKETPGNGRDDDGNGYVDDYYGVNIVRGGGDATDTNGHGTHVAGIIAARGDNGMGVSGVCWTGSVMAVKFMNAVGQGKVSDAAEGIAYAVRKGAKVINGSFGSASNSTTLHDAVKEAKENGVLLVVAAGNDGMNNDKTPVYPASWTDGNILAVAASTDDDGLASFSNYGASSVDVAAPGEGIVSTYLGGLYASQSGTSMAAPFIAGMAGVLRARNSSATYSELRTGLRQKVDKPAAFKDKVLYDGRANLVRALDYIETK